MSEQNKNAQRGFEEADRALTREAQRLLRRLDAAGCDALPDPDTPEDLILRVGGPGPSLGAGRVPLASAAPLLARGLAERRPGRSGAIVISEAGRAHLRRAACSGPEPYAAQHRELVASEGEPSVRNACESPLAWMARRRGRDGAPFIDAVCLEAGERLRSDLTLAAMMPRVTLDWGRPRVDGGASRETGAGNDATIAARQRVDGAVRAVGADLSGPLIDLCGFLKGLERIEAEHGWPARSAKVVIRLALGRLAEHYGMEREAVGPDRGRLRLWRAGPGPDGAS